MTGQVLTSAGGRSVVRVNADRMRAVAPKGAVSGEKVKRSLRELLKLPNQRASMEARIISSNPREGFTIEEIEIVHERPLRIPGWFMKPPDAGGRTPVVLMVTETGKDELLEEGGLAETLVRRGIAVCSFDLRGLGVTAPKYPSAGPLFYGADLAEPWAWACLTLGRPILGQRVEDFLSCLDYVASRRDVDTQRLAVHGVAGGAMIALLGAALDERCRSVLLERPLTDLRSVVESDEYSLRLPWFVFGMLREMDLPDAAAALAPRPCTILNATGARGESLAESTVRERMKTTVEAYGAAGQAGRLSVLVEAEAERPRAVARWAEAI